MTTEEWRKLYRSEIRRSARRRLLDESPEPADTPEMILRRQLMDARYQMQGEQEIDTFIRGWVNAAMLNNGKGSIRMNPRTVRQAESILADWQLETAEALGPAGAGVLEDEFYNMVLLYIALSKNDHKYSRTLFGLKQLEKKEIIRKLAADIRRVAIEVPEDLGLQKRLAPLRRAAQEAFYDATEQEL